MGEIKGRITHRLRLDSRFCNKLNKLCRWETALRPMDLERPCSSDPFTGAPRSGWPQGGATSNGCDSESN